MHSLLVHIFQHTNRLVKMGIRRSQGPPTAIRYFKLGDLGTIFLVTTSHTSVSLLVYLETSKCPDLVTSPAQMGLTRCGIYVHSAPRRAILP